MKLLITGSRKCTESDYVKFEEFLNNLIVEKDLEITEMIHGGAKGADQFADRWAKARMIPVTTIRPDYNKYGTPAPLIRNDELVKMCDACVAVFKYKKKGGTWYTVCQASRVNKFIGELLIDFT